jgi:hypothetical protein
VAAAPRRRPAQVQTLLLVDETALESFLLLTLDVLTTMKMTTTRLCRQGVSSISIGQLFMVVVVDVVSKQP